MTSALLSAGGLRSGDPDERALAWRAASGWTRTAQASLVGVLVWMATGESQALGWLALSASAHAGTIHRGCRMVVPPAISSPLQNVGPAPQGCIEYTAAPCFPSS